MKVCFVMKVCSLALAGFLCLSACKKKPETPVPVDSVPPISEDGDEIPETSTTVSVTGPTSPQTRDDSTGDSTEVATAEPASSPAGGEDTPGGSSKVVVAEPAPPKREDAVTSPVGGGPAPEGSPEASVTEPAPPKREDVAVELAKAPVAPDQPAPSDPLKSLPEEDFAFLADFPLSAGEASWKNIAHSEAIKDRGGSLLFHNYVLFTVLFVNYLMKNPPQDEQAQQDDLMPLEYREALRHLCKDPKCEKGLDVTRLNPDDLHLILRYFSSTHEVITLNSKKNPSQNVAFLQGQLSFPGWGPSYYRLLFREEGTKPDEAGHIKQKKQMLSDADHILVNLPHQFGSDPDRNQHYDVNMFMELGRIIREKKLNLHIGGGCGTLCANYLLPAAKTIYIEPYGYIYTQGGIGGLFMAAALASPVYKDDQLKRLKEEWLPLLTDSSPAASGSESDNALVSFVTEIMLEYFGFKEVETSGTTEGTKAQQKKKDVRDAFLTNLSKWGQEEWGDEKWQKFSNHVKGHQNTVNRPIRNWTDTDLKSFVRSMNNKRQRYFLEELALFLQLSRESKDVISYMKDLRWLRPYTLAYHREMRTPRTFLYERFLDVISQLVRDERYESLFAVPKTYYAVSEGEKWHVAAPSAKVLRAMGMDVRGENNRDMLDRRWGDKVLYLGDRQMKNCQFFKSLDTYLKEDRENRLPQSAYTKATLETCLSLE